MTDLHGIQKAVGQAAHDLIDAVVSDLGSTGPGQRDRLLRLHTPLGRDVLLPERAEVTEVVGPQEGAPLGFRVEVLALSTRPGLAAPDLLGQPVLLELLTAHSRHQLRPFHGHVTRFELLGSDGGLSRYRLIVEPWTAFMAHRVDAWSFQGVTVQGVVDQLVNDYAGQGTVAARVRWDLRDASAYPVLSLYTQHHESDLAFLQRTLAHHGLFCWFEHEGRLDDPTTLGSHTLVIADHNGALRPNAQETIRFTQAAAQIKEDSLTWWSGRRQVGATAVQHASWDYREVVSHAADSSVQDTHNQPMALIQHDQPGAYLFETPQEAHRQARARREALEARRKQFEGRATVRTLSPGTTFVLHDHAEHDQDRAAGGDECARFAVLSVTHRVRNNLRADAKAGLQHLLGPHLLSSPGARALPNATEEPVYEACFVAQRAHVPVRPAASPLHPAPTVHGAQTALVVGLQAPIHTDRDGRVKVQFHWQRGRDGSHRLTHPSPSPDADNAPASDASGTWVRVGQPWAGANWGGVFLPRLGQEVVVAFLEGDIDRPVIVGAAYNGQGNVDAQGNGVGSGSAGATGNAPAWFPGSARQGRHEGHAHTATLSGFKSQCLDASQTGAGDHNQLVFDDTPGQGRLLAHTTTHQTWLQMGHLLQQDDNQRLAPRGHGLELHTQGQGALRAGSGLHLSTHDRPAGTSSPQGRPTDTHEAQQQLQAHAELLQVLSANAQTHRAQLPREAAADQLPARLALQNTLDSLRRQVSSTGDTASWPDTPA